jgi:hypothetical protein
VVKIASVTLGGTGTSATAGRLALVCEISHVGQHGKTILALISAVEPWTQARSSRFERSESRQGLMTVAALL